MQLGLHMPTYMCCSYNKIYFLLIWVITLLYTWKIHKLQTQFKVYLNSSGSNLEDSKEGDLDGSDTSGPSSDKNSSFMKVIFLLSVFTYFFSL